MRIIGRQRDQTVDENIRRSDDRYFHEKQEINYRKFMRDKVVGDGAHKKKIRIRMKSFT
jgi:hypothetical protein